MSDDFYRPSPTEFAASAVSPFMDIARKVYLGEAGGDEKEYAILGMAHVLKREFEGIQVVTVEVGEREFYGGTAVPAPADGDWVNGVNTEAGWETANSILSHRVDALHTELDKALAAALTLHNDLDQRNATIRDLQNLLEGEERRVELAQAKLEQVYAREDQLKRDLHTEADMYERARVGRESVANDLIRARADMTELLYLYRRQAVCAYQSGSMYMFYYLNEHSMNAEEREECARRANARFPYVSETFRDKDDIVTRYNDIARKYANGQFLIPIPDPPAIETTPNQS